MGYLGQGVGRLSLNAEVVLSVTGLRVCDGLAQSSG